jgi:hypothetical protein
LTPIPETNCENSLLYKNNLIAMAGDSLPMACYDFSQAQISGIAG